jgi:phosphatidylglycerophosphate synthase
VDVDVTADPEAGDASVPPLREFVSRRFAVRSPFWSWLLFERAGGAFAYLFARLRVTPSTVTLLGGISGVSGAAVLATSSEPVDLVLAGGLLLLGYTFDCADGQLARATGQTSARGAWLDVTIDAVVVAFVAVALSAALTADSGLSSLSFLLAGAFGASRTASLFTATRVRSSENGGLHLSGWKHVLRTAYGASTDTPFVYATLCATRLEPTLFRVAIVVFTVLTVVRMLVSAQHHFRAEADSAG